MSDAEPWSILVADRDPEIPFAASLAYARSLLGSDRVIAVRFAERGYERRALECDERAGLECGERAGFECDERGRLECDDRAGLECNDRARTVVQPAYPGTACGVLLALLRIPLRVSDPRIVLLFSESMFEPSATARMALDRAIGIVNGDPEAVVGLEPEPTASAHPAVAPLLRTTPAGASFLTSTPAGLSRPPLLVAAYHELLRLYREHLPEVYWPILVSLATGGASAVEHGPLYETLPVKQVWENLIRDSSPGVRLISRRGWIEPAPSGPNGCGSGSVGISLVDVMYGLSYPFVASRGP